MPMQKFLQYSRICSIRSHVWLLPTFIQVIWSQNILYIHVIYLFFLKFLLLVKHLADETIILKPHVCPMSVSKQKLLGISIDLE